MIIEILEGRITQERWDSFEHAYRKSLINIPNQINENFLIQDVKDKDLWRIISIWRDQSFFEETSKTQVCATCVEIFEAIGVEPTHRVFEVKGHHRHV